MDLSLKDKKYIYNTKSLPGLWDADTSKLTGFEKFKSRWNNGGGEKAMGAAIQGLDAMQQFNSMKYPTNYANDFVGKYGYTEGNIDGFKFQQYKDIDTNAEENRMSQIRDSKIMSGAMTGATTGLSIGTAAGLLAGAGSGAATGAGLGAWLGPIGAVAGLGLGALFGGIFGNSAKNEEEEQMRIAQIKQNNANEFWRTGALSASLRNKALERYGDTSRFNLYSSAFGSENVHTSKGVKPGEPNAKVDNGEIIEGKDGSAHQVVGNPYVTDGEYAKLHNGDNIYSNKLTVPGTNITYAQAYPMMKSIGREKELLALQPISREMAKKTKNKDGLIHAWNGWENLLATVPGFIQSWRDYNDAANDTPHYTDIKPVNPYERKAAEIMAGRRMSAYPQMRAITNEDAAQRYRINMSGGMSAMQKTMANIANNMNSKIARANALANVQQINNQFAKENAELLDKMGAQSMDANMRAQMFNEQQNAAANAARTQQMSMAKRNMLDYATQFAKNAWERNQFDQMMNLYWEQVKNDRMKNQKPSNAPSTWSLNGDINEEQKFEKYAPTPFTSAPFVRKDKFGLPIKDPEFIPDAVKWSFNDMIKMRNLKRKRR